MQETLAYISTQLQTLEGIENLYHALPFIQDKAGFISEFQSTLLTSLFPDEQYFQAWEISNSAGNEIDDDGGNLYQWQDIIQINGWLKFSQQPNESATQMQSWVDQIKVLFKNDKKLGGTVRVRGPLRLLSNQPDWFYSTLCHRSVFEMAVFSLIKK